MVSIMTSEAGELIILRLGDIRTEHVNKLISFPATVYDVERNGIRLVEGAFECARCGNMIYLPQDPVNNKYLEHPHPVHATRIGRAFFGCLKGSPPSRTSRCPRYTMGIKNTG